MSESIIIADGGLTCFYCEHVFDPADAPSLEIPSATLIRCPSCGRYTEDR